MRHDGAMAGMPAGVKGAGGVSVSSVRLASMPPTLDATAAPLAMRPLQALALPRSPQLGGLAWAMVSILWLCRGAGVGRHALSSELPEVMQRLQSGHRYCVAAITGALYLRSCRKNK